MIILAIIHKKAPPTLADVLNLCHVKKTARNEFAPHYEPIKNAFTGGR